VALFGKKKDDTADGGTDAAGAGPGEGGFNPDKAKVFFEKAQIVYDTSNFGYAVQLWLNGLAQDPSSVDGFKGFAQAVTALVDEEKKPNGKEIAKGLQGLGKIGKYQHALLAWGLKRGDMTAALKAADAAAGLGLVEQTKILGRDAFNLALSDRKRRKDVFVKLLDVFAAANCYDLAIEAGQVAKQIDPADGPLDARLKQMMAQAAITRGGFDDKSEGGFRKNIRDMDKQTLLEGADAIVKTEDVKDRLLADAEAAYNENPADLTAIDRYGKALLDRGKPVDEMRAITLFTKAHTETGQFRYRQRAGEVMIRRMRAGIRALQKKSEAAPDDAEVATKLEHANAQLMAKEVEELKLQVENYPTDLGLKFELGKRCFIRGEYDDAIELFQVAQDDAKHRRQVLNYMGQAFLKLGGWEDAAIETFRRALAEMPDEKTDLGMEMRYFLMCALADKAKAAGDVDTAEEADKLAAGIAIEKFNYRDIRDRRTAIKALINELKAG
jgi:tetratricopeptide (TPR) repeat protein